MYSKAKISGHSIHPMIVPFPIAFYTATLISYIIFSVNADPFWFRVGFASNVAGVVMALIAASVGFIDWSLGIPERTPAKRHGLHHMLFNITALVLFAINIWTNSGQWNNPAPESHFAVILSALGFFMTLAAGYLGWTLVQIDHVGVEFSPGEERCLHDVSKERPIL